LAGAVLAEECNDLAGIEAEAHPIERLGAAELLGDVLDDEEVPGHRHAMLIPGGRTGALPIGIHRRASSSRRPCCSADHFRSRRSAGMLLVFGRMPWPNQGARGRRKSDWLKEKEFGKLVNLILPTLGSAWQAKAA